MKSKRTEVHVIEGEERTVEVGLPELSDLVRDGRKAHRISLRELARRSGVSAGQLSRIESGDVGRPSVETLQSIADALGRPSAPLLLLAGHIDRAEFDLQSQPLVSEIDRMSEMVEDIFESEAHLAENLWHVGDAQLAAGRLGGDAWHEIHDDLEEIAQAWRSLTPERRQLVRAFVADQEVMSTLERMPSPPGRYEVDVKLARREGAESE